MSSPWSMHCDPRAVVADTSVLGVADILQASTSLALHSPCSFGIGISRVLHSGRLQSSELYYVSPRAAADRSADVDARNARGVRPGWYVAGRPGEEFEICVSMLHGAGSVRRMTAGVEGDMVIAKVYVDGTRAGAYGITPAEVEMDDICVRGFVESCHVDGKSDTRHVLSRKFVFCKSFMDEEGHDFDEGYGCVRLELSTAVRSCKRRGGSAFERRFKLENHRGVNEKVAAKNGISIGVRRDGESILEACEEPQFTFHSARPIDGGVITIYVRERFWLESRRIIDCRERAVKFADAWKIAGVKEKEVVEVRSSKGWMAKRKSQDDQVIVIE